jgi:hypothetical protein
MTETFTSNLAHWIVNRGGQERISLGVMFGLSFVWIFEFRSLEFVWDLGIGAWNFHDFR